VSDLPPLSVWKASGATWEMAGQVVGYSSLTIERRHNGPGTWSMSMPYSTQAALLTKTRLVTFDFRGERFTGRIRHLAPGADEKGQPQLEVSGTGALSYLAGVTVWPDPAATLATQTVARYAATGVAETVLRNVIIANVVTRRGNSLTIPATAGRGASIELSERFTNLLEVTTKGARRGGLGVRMGLVNTTSSTRAQMQLDFYTPTDRSARVRLSHKVGTLRTWKQSDDAPTATRAIVGGGGKGTARVFRSITDTAAEAAWGWSEEVFVDQRGTTGNGKLDQAGQEALDDAAAQSSFELEAAEAEGMRLITHYNVGDLVTVELLTGVSSVERLNAAGIEVGSDGLKVHLIPGNPDADPSTKTSALIRAMNRRLRNLEQEES
jgi:hypothetical protein